MPGEWNADRGETSKAGAYSGIVHSRPSSPSVTANFQRERSRTPGKRSSIQADRYIPTRQSLDGQTAAFQLMDGSPSTPHRYKRKMIPEMDAEQEEADHAFANLLGSEIFGHDPAASGSSSSAPSSVSRSGSRPSAHTPTTPTRRNLFSYNSPSSSRSRSSGPASRGRDDTRRIDRSSVGSLPASNGSGQPGGGLFGSAKKSSNAVVVPPGSPSHRAYDTSPVRLDSQRMLLSPRRAPRTVSKVPFKVLDAPDLAVSGEGAKEWRFAIVVAELIRFLSYLCRTISISISSTGPRLIHWE